jgi:hypothetical protein
MGSRRSEEEGWLGGRHRPIGRDPATSGAAGSGAICVGSGSRPVGRRRLGTGSYGFGCRVLDAPGLGDSRSRRRPAAGPAAMAAETPPQSPLRKIKLPTCVITMHCIDTVVCIARFYLFFYTYAQRAPYTVEQVLQRRNSCANAITKLSIHSHARASPPPG